MYYLVGIASTSEYEATTIETLYATILNSYAYACYSSDVTLENGLPQLLKKGTATYSASGISPETEYIAYAVGVDITTGYPASAYEIARYSTAAVEVPDGDIGEVTISNVTMLEATATVTGTTYEGVYSLIPISSRYLESEYNGDVVAAIQNTTVEAATEVIAYGYTIEDFVDNNTFFKGDCTVEMSDFDIGDTHGKLGPESEYIILTAGISAQGYVITDVGEVRFTTEDLPDDYKIDIEVYDATQFSATIKTTPSYDDIDYAVYAFPTELFNSLTTDELGEELKAGYGAWFFWMLKDNADNVRFVDEFEADTDYTAFAYVYAIGTGVIGEVYTTEFRTLAMPSSTSQNDNSYVFDKLGLSPWKGDSYYSSRIDDSKAVTAPYQITDFKAPRKIIELLSTEETIEQFNTSNPKPIKSVSSTLKFN